MKIKDMAVDHEVFLVCLGFTKQKIREFNSNNFGNKDRVLVDALEHFIQNCEEGYEWKKIHNVLKTCGDVKTAEKIRPLITQGMLELLECVLEFTLYYD